jgi:hypothetical protein
VFEHLQEREGGDVNLLGGVHHRGVRRRGRSARSPNRRQVTLQAIHDSSLRSTLQDPIVYGLLSSRKRTRALPPQSVGVLELQIVVECETGRSVSVGM